MPNSVIKFAIASHINYYHKTLPVLIPSLLSCGINENEIFVFVSGCSEEKQVLKDNITYYYINYNSFECSALIAIAEKEIVSEYWCLLHDTCKAGINFKKLVYQIPSEKPDKIALRDPCSMSIGCYRYDYLISIKQTLQDIKKTDVTEEGAKLIKQWAVCNEDIILWKTGPTPAVYNGGTGGYDWSVIDNLNWYNDGSERRTEYFPSLDLYKNKANWGQYPDGSHRVGL